MSTTDLMLLPASDTRSALTVLHLEGGRWRLQPPPVGGVTPAEALVGVEDILERIVRELDEPTEDYLLAMQEPMQALYTSVIPGELATMLKAEADAAAAADPPVLRIHLTEGLDSFPWEMMHDGTAYLGLRYRIGRLPLVSGGPRPANGRPKVLRSVVSLLGEDVLEAQDVLQAQLRTKWEGTFTGIVGQGVEVTRKPSTNDWPTLGALANQQADILYVVCHGLRNVNGDVIWSLNDNKPGSPTYSVGPRQARTLNLGVREPLVFANACHPLGGGLAVTTHDLARAQFGFQFFSFGASAFVGTMAPISKAVAIPFATTFFTHLISESRTVGGALLATKLDFRKAEGLDPSYLFYALYGDPDLTFAQGD